MGATRGAVEWANLAAVLFALILSSYAVVRSAPSDREPPPLVAAPAPVDGSLALRADGSRALRDATGWEVPLVAYHRIASGSLLADPLLLALCAPTDIVAFSARAPLSRDAHRYEGKPSVDALRRQEQLLALAPDLVLVNSLGDHARVQRLRDLGLTVFDLGPMHGVETFLGSVTAVGWLAGRPEAARELSRRFTTRLRAIARHLAPAERKGALYLAVHGPKLYGGTRGSSYHDVLEHAGLTDVAAREFQGWPSYDPEQVLSLDPELVVGATGTRQQLCRGELSRLRACGARGRVVEIPSELLNDAGWGLLDAAELVHEVAYSEVAAP